MADQPSLTVLGGPLGGRRFAFENGVDSALIGSDPSCTFRLELAGVSPIHARVRYDAGAVNVYDTQSPRGLFVNDDRVVTQIPLRNGDILWLGTPGEPGVVMIQCRVPPSTGASPAGTHEETQAISADADAMVAEPIMEEVEPTVSISPTRSSEETVLQSPAPSADTDDFFGETQAVSAPSWSDNQLPSSFSVEPPTLQHAPAVPFEDETDGEALPATVIVPPPAPAPPPPAPAPRPAPVAAPRPAPPAAKPSAPPTVARKPAAMPTPLPPARPAAPPMAVPASAPRRPASGGGGGKTAVLAGGALVVIAAGVLGAFLMKKEPTTTSVATPTPIAATPAATAPPATPATNAGTPTAAPAATAAPSTPEPTPDTTTTAKPTVAATATATTATPTKGTPTKAATAAPTAATAATANPGAQLAAIKSQADKALAGGQYDAAVGHFDEMLRMSPGDAEATAGRARAIAFRDSLRKRFSPGKTSVTSGKAGKATITGFEGADVKVASDYSARIDFETKPEHVKPGDSYQIRVFVTNDGKKALKLGSVTVNSATNGSRSGGPISARVKEIEPQANVLLEEFPGVWADGTTSWSMEVVVTSNRGDVFKNTLSWK